MDELRGIDGPRPFPEEMRANLEASLVNPLLGIDHPRPLPPALHDLLLHSLGNSPANRRAITQRMRVVGVAAALLLGLAMAALLAHEPGKGRGAPGLAAGPPATAASGSTEPGALGGVAAAGGAAADSSGAPPAAAAASGVAGHTAPSAAGGAAASAGPGSGATAAPALRVEVLGGDQAAESAFRAYIAKANATGSGRPVTLVAGHQGQTVPDTVGSVNLSGEPVASAGGPPSWLPTPLLETLTIPGGDLHGDVFDAAGDVEREARLAVDAAFPVPSPGARAVIYQMASGVLSREVPAAMEAELQAKGVVPVHVTVGSGPTPFPVADAAFLSLRTAEAKAWLSDAKGAGFAPTRGTVAMSPAADQALAPGMPDGTRVVSPFLLEDDGQRTLSADAIHGWLTAKLLVESVRRSGGVSSGGLQQAMTGYDDGFGRRYSTRPGSNIRTPDAVILRADHGRLEPEGGFLTDAD